MDKRLFDEFDATSKATWHQQVLKDLRGKSFDTLLWQTDLGFEIAPYYTQDDIADERIEEIRLSQKSTSGWLNKPLVLYTDEHTTHQQMLHAQQNGAEAILLDFGLTDITSVSFVKLLHGIKLSEIPVFFRTYNQANQVLASLQAFIAYQMQGGLIDDVLGRWLQTGHIASDAFDATALRLQNASTSPYFRVLCIDGGVFHNAGANATQELAYMLAAAVTYLDKLTDRGFTVEQIAAKMFFSVSVGTNYFVEIAKFRALRYLWKEVQRQWAVVPMPAYIHASNSVFYDAATTVNTNMLRSTTEAMSAVMGGCDTLTLRSYDSIVGISNDFSARIARNISTILKEEAHLDKSADPAAGSYFIEHLTLQLVNAAWALFLEVEQKGGLMTAVEQNFIQSHIEDTFETRLTALKTNQRIMVGVNQFRFDETPISSYTNQEATSTNSSFQTLPSRRLSEYFERD